MMPKKDRQRLYYPAEITEAEKIQQISFRVVSIILLLVFASGLVLGYMLAKII